MSKASASMQATRPRLSDTHKRRLQMVVEIPPSPFHRTAALRPTPITIPISKPEYPPSTSTSSQSKLNDALSSTSNSLKRKLGVFVEIPSFPLHRTASTSSLHSADTGIITNSARRRLEVFVEIPPSPLHSKGGRARLKGSPLSSKAFNSNTSAIPEPPEKKRKLINASEKAGDSEMNTAEKFPNGSFFCHQCHGKRDNRKGLRCTTTAVKRCSTKYCNRCIKSRYGEDLEVLRRRAAPEHGKQHVTNEGYFWTCFKCAGKCNCYKCRKAQGLEPTGKLPNMFQSGTETDIAWKVPANGDSGAATVAAAIARSANEVMRIDPKPRMGRPKKVVREPKWTPVPTTLDLAQAEDRFLLREFVLRFAPLMKIGTTYLEDLDVFDSLSDACAKTIIINLLDFIAADAEPKEQKSIKGALNRISRPGTSSRALWANIASLRSALPGSVPIPEPAPAPAHAFPDSESEPQPHRTSSRIKSREPTPSSNLDTDVVVDPSVRKAVQLIPPILALYECALQGASAREEIENGVADGKEANRMYYAKTREENERWAAEKANLGHEEDKENKSGKKNTDAKGSGKEKDAHKDEAYRAAYKAHKDKLDALDHTNTLALQRAASRFASLGKDAQGRIYYAASVHRRAGKRSKIPSPEERAELSKWGWFLAVWGRGSVTAETSNKHEENREERWWGFADPAEIKQLVKWITATEGLDLKDADVAGTSAGTASASSSDDIGPAAGNIREPDLLGLGRRPSRGELKALIKSLGEYADLLAWRIAGGVEP
ncbi:hypothetical protein EW145_g3012 [Phellinidium pouzarii]|uniref:Zinc-finger domain-containing protein n=1 Tax=Phellinidium pouzarii TaxID=167371 RepID=A0A4S4L8X2_9AGAM|nr:hypothetical protein EW145_g3012 [Phellinidium pouzarii]